MKSCISLLFVVLTACGAESSASRHSATPQDAALALRPRGACVGTPTPCAAAAARGCTSQRGCMQDFEEGNLKPACVGTPDPCADFSLASLCFTHTGCTWDPQQAALPSYPHRSPTA
jgi:hypothetical protein